MNNSLVSVNIVVLNGEKYIRGCLDSVLAQTYLHENIEINILDNGSIDQTVPLIENCKLKFENSSFSRFKFIKNEKNLGMWGGQEELLKHTQGFCVVVLSVDVILGKDFIKNAVEKMDSNPQLGAIQAKVYRYNIQDVVEVKPQQQKIIDTCGFQIYRSRKISNIGHGEEDSGQYNQPCEIFGVEGAVPVIRTEALESIRIGSPSTGSGPSEIADHDLFWYAEDLDIAWRLNLAGWKQKYEPSLIAWHDRQTTKRTSGSFKDFLMIRRSIPLRKRRLEWRNIRCTIIKNDYIINILKDLPYWLPREIAMFGYLLIFETRVLSEIFALILFLPRMLRKRSQILSRTKTNARQIHLYFA